MSEPTEQDLKHILDNVNFIKMKYDDIAKITGENFNIFRIMNMEHKEVHPHSSLIAELLNEKGSHGQGNLFLNLFLQVINTKINNWNITNQLQHSFIDDFNGSQAITEYSIGEVSRDYYEGGRIDILVEDSDQIIVIENKIGADDQKNQLLRYFNYAKRTNKKFIVLYLCKFPLLLNENSSSYTLGENKEECKMVLSKTISISYEYDIKEWIKLCLKEVYQLPLIREILTHYLHTINTITNQSRNNKMKADIEKTLLSNLNTALFIADNKDVLLKAVMTKVGENIKRLNDSNFEFKFEISDSGGDFIFTNEKYNLIFMAFSTDYNSTSFGIEENDNYTFSQNEKNEIQVKLSKCTFGKIENWTNWIWNTRFDLWSSTPWEMKLEDTFAKQIINKVNEVFNLLK
jgi:hypothetical protein